MPFKFQIQYCLHIVKKIFDNIAYIVFNLYKIRLAIKIWGDMHQWYLLVPILGYLQPLKQMVWRVEDSVLNFNSHSLRILYRYYKQ